MNRKTELNLVVGINGTGKTTFIKEKIVEKSKKSLIVTPDYAEWRNLPLIETPEQIKNLQGAARIIYKDSSTLENIKKSFSGGNLILDDAMAYLNEQTPNTMSYMYIRRRQYGIDLYIVAHGLRQLPPKAFTYGSWLFLFNTSENFTARKKELLPEVYEKIIKTQNEIGKKVIKGEPYHYEIILLDQQIKGTYIAQRSSL
jgi:hypothetical protein